jgi:hypothetical protein
MGWDFTKGASKKDIVEGIKRSIGANLRASKLVGKEFWVVEEQAPGKLQIVLFLLEKDGGFGWGYKDMTEAMGPYYYGCPLEFLDMAPVANASWREKLRLVYARPAA